MRCAWRWCATASCDQKPGGTSCFQTSTIEALLGGAFDGDVSLSEILQHGDLGLGTLNGLDGELIVIDGQAWKANRDCRLIRAPGSSRTPYAVVVPFSPGPPVTLRGPLQYAARPEERLDLNQERRRVCLPEKEIHLAVQQLDERVHGPQYGLCFREIAPETSLAPSCSERWLLRRRRRPRFLAPGVRRPIPFRARPE